MLIQFNYDSLQIYHGGREFAIDDFAKYVEELENKAEERARLFHDHSVCFAKPYVDKLMEERSKLLEQLKAANEVLHAKQAGRDAVISELKAEIEQLKKDNAAKLECIRNWENKYDGEIDKLKKDNAAYVEDISRLRGKTCRTDRLEDIYAQLEQIRKAVGIE